MPEQTIPISEVHPRALCCLGDDTPWIGSTSHCHLFPRIPHLIHIGRSVSSPLSCAFVRLSHAKVPVCPPLIHVPRKKSWIKGLREVGGDSILLVWGKVGQSGGSRHEARGFN